MLEFLSTDGIARLCSLTREQAENLVYSGELQVIEVMPGERRVLASTLVDYLNRQAMKSRAGGVMSDDDLTVALAKAIEDDEVLRCQLASMSPGSGTFAEMLKNAATATSHACDSSADNVIQFPSSATRH